jgi:hypothetical protein
MYIHTHIHTYIHTNMNTYIHTHPYTYIHTYCENAFFIVLQLHGKAGRITGSSYPARFPMQL